MNSQTIWITISVMLRKKSGICIVFARTRNEQQNCVYAHLLSSLIEIDTLVEYMELLLEQKLNCLFLMKWQALF
jgi:hypothetical protein